jgi:hypothetical protein
MEFVLFIVMTFLAIETIIFGVKLLRKEHKAVKDLRIRIQGDAKVLVAEAEEWLKGKFKGDTRGV